MHVGKRTLAHDRKHVQRPTLYATRATTAVTLNGTRCHALQGIVRFPRPGSSFGQRPPRLAWCLPRSVHCVRRELQPRNLPMILLYDLEDLIADEQAMPSTFRMFVMSDEVII